MSNLNVLIKSNVVFLNQVGQPCLPCVERGGGVRRRLSYTKTVICLLLLVMGG